MRKSFIRNSADPYEVLAYILQNCYHIQSTPEIIGLIHHLLDLTRDPFIRSESYVRWLISLEYKR